MTTFDDQVTTARAKAQWDIWKDNIIQRKLDLSKCLSEVYLHNGTSRKKKEIEYASKVLGLYCLLRSKLVGKIRFDEKKKFIHLLELDKLDPEKEVDLAQMRGYMIDLFHMIDSLGYTRVEEIMHNAIRVEDF